MANYKLYEISIPPLNEKKDRILYTIFNVIFIFFVLITICLLFLLLTSLNIILFMFTIINVLLALVFMVIKNKYNCFYDYNFIDGELRLDKVIKNKIRRRILTIQSKNIEELGICCGDKFNNYLKNSSYKNIYAVHKNRLDNSFYIVTNLNGNKNLVILFLDKNLIYSLLKYIDNKVLTKEFIDKIKNYE